MPSRLDGPKAKIKRAKEHVADLDSDIAAFLKRDPYRLVPKVEPKSGDLHFQVRIREQIGWRAECIVGDILHNLRSSLELLAWQIVESEGAIPGDERARQRIGFPVSESAEEFEAKGLRKVDGASKHAIDVLRAVQPYKGGNDALWRLHHLNRTDKHRRIGLVSTGGGQIGLTWPPVSLLPEMAQMFATSADHIPRATVWINPANPKFPLENGDVVFRVAKQVHEAKHYEHPQVSISIALGQPGIVEGEPVLPLLAQLGSAVEEVVKRFYWLK